MLAFSPLFVRSCVIGRKITGNEAFTLGQATMFAIGVACPLVCLISLLWFHRSSYGTLQFNVTMFLLASGFMTRVCLGVTECKRSRR